MISLWKLHSAGLHLPRVSGTASKVARGLETNSYKDSLKEPTFWHKNEFEGLSGTEERSVLFNVSWISHLESVGKSYREITSRRNKLWWRDTEFWASVRWRGFVVGGKVPWCAFGSAQEMRGQTTHVSPLSAPHCFPPGSYYSRNSSSGTLQRPSPLALVLEQGQHRRMGRHSTALMNLQADENTAARLPPGMHIEGQLHYGIKVWHQLTTVSRQLLPLLLWLNLC